MMFKLTADSMKEFVGLTDWESMKLDDYWSADLGNPIFKDTMSQQKLRFTHYLCLMTRTERLTSLGQIHLQGYLRYLMNL